MKSSLLTSALVAIAGVALCAPVALQAQTNTTNPIATSPVQNPPASTSTASSTMSTAKSMAKTPYRGTVKDVSATSLTVTTSKGDLMLAINDMTKVKVDRKTATAGDVKTGEKVTGSYTKDDSGNMTACSIHAKTK